MGQSNGAATACTISSATPTTPSCGAATMKLGWDGTNSYRVLLQVPDLSVALPKDAKLVQASVVLTSLSVTPSGAAPAVQAYRATRSWTNPTWNSAATGTAWASAGGDFDTTTTAYAAPGYSNAATSTGFADSITGLVADWLSGTVANNGLLIKEKSESTNYVNTLAGPGASSGAAGTRPGLSVVWSHNLGNQTSSSPLQRNLTDRLSLAINPADGNAVVQGSLLDLAGVGQKLSLGYAINSTATNTSTNFDTASTHLQNPSQTADLSLVYTQPDGQPQPFIRSGATTYQSPAALNATMSVDAALTTWKLRFNDTGVTNTYTRSGSSWMLQSSADPSGNTVTYNYSGNQLTSIGDTQGRTITIGLNASYKPSTITDTSTGRSASLSWAAAPTGGSELQSVTDLAGKTTSFGYTATAVQSNLTSITDPDGHVTTIATTNQGPWLADSRTDSVVFGSGTTAASTYAWGYPSYGTSTLTDPNGGVTTYTWDSGDRGHPRRRPAWAQHQLELVPRQQAAVAYRRPEPGHQLPVQQPEQPAQDHLTGRHRHQSLQLLQLPDGHRRAVRLPAHLVQGCAGQHHQLHLQQQLPAGDGTERGRRRRHTDQPLPGRQRHLVYQRQAR